MWSWQKWLQPSSAKLQSQSFSHRSHTFLWDQENLETLHMYIHPGFPNVFTSDHWTFNRQTPFISLSHWRKNTNETNHTKQQKKKERNVIQQITNQHHHQTITPTPLFSPQQNRENSEFFFIWFPFFFFSLRPEGAEDIPQRLCPKVECFCCWLTVFVPKPKTSKNKTKKLQQAHAGLTKRRKTYIIVNEELDDNNSC